MSAFLNSATQSSQAQNLAFESWLSETCMNTVLSETKREELLVHWENAPAARYCHPREEHLLPLHVCYGAAGSAAKQVFSFNILGKTASCFLW